MLKSILWRAYLLLKAILFRTVFKKIDTVNNRIFVMTYSGSYSDNQKYIIDEIIRRELPVEVMYVYNHRDSIKGFPPELIPVKYGSVKMFIGQLSSKIWLDNALNCVWFGLPKKAEQVYINTWHGSMGIKKLSGNKRWLRRAQRCKSLTDYCITNSKFEEDVFRNTFWPETPFLKFGHARNDILFKTENHESLRGQIAKKLNISISQDSKWLLYGPTFRDNGDTSCFNIDFVKLKEALETRFPGTWKILVRMHYKNKDISNSFEYNDWLIDTTSYDDMQELLSTVDAGITDYSSWAYDFVLTGRPMFLYLPDLDSYDQERGFYYPIESTPFPIGKDNDGLVNAVLNFDKESYQKKVTSFLIDKGCYEDGHSAQRTVDFLEKYLYLS